MRVWLCRSQLRSQRVSQSTVCSMHSIASACGTALTLWSRVMMFSVVALTLSPICMPPTAWSALPNAALSLATRTRASKPLMRCGLAGFVP